MAGGKRARAAALAPDRRLFLQTYRELAVRGGTINGACRAAGITLKVYERWRRNPLFKATMDALKIELAAHRAAGSHAEKQAAAALTPLAAEDGGLTPEQILYIDHWRKTQDRKASWERAGLTWQLVKKARAESPAFAAACGEVEEEMEVQAEDAQRRRAVETGDTAAINSLRKAGITQAANKKAGDSPADRRARVAKLRQQLGRPN